MIRLAFLRRMAFAALSCGFLDVRLPEVESGPGFVDGTEWVELRQLWEHDRVRMWHDGVLVHDGPSYGPIPIAPWGKHGHGPVEMTYQVPRELLV